jgi:hypothetical protein
MGLHMTFQDLAGSLLIAVNSQVATLGMPVAQDLESRPGQADMPRPQKREPTQCEKMAP